MAFYVAKGMQLAGLLGVGFALYLGMIGESLMREVIVASLGAVFFYVGRSIEA